MKKKDQNRLEKLLYSMIGLQPDTFGLVTDENGWIELKDVYHALAAEKAGFRMTARSLGQFFELYRPEKFECREKFVRVKPEFQEQELCYFPETVPPELLYICIRPRAHAHVLDHGLKPGGTRKWLVLCRDSETALMIGRRRDLEPILAEVTAYRCHEAGTVFRKSGNSLYLVEHLDACWMNIPPLPGNREKTRGRKDTDKTQPASRPSLKKEIYPEAIGGYIVRDIPSGIYHNSEKETANRKGRKSARKDPEWKKTRRKKRRR